MHHISFFPISLCCCLFFLIISHENFSPITAISVDIINQTCRKCADESHVFSYDLCTTSLQAVPVSHVANLQGLALIAMELALNNASSTLQIIKNLLMSNESLDPFVVVCLKDCLQLYSDGITTLEDTEGAFLGEHYDNANICLSAVMEASSTCEEGFKEKEGEVLPSPLTNENYNLFQLCDIALCIGHLLTSGSTFLMRSSAT
ncbi:putative pectinesterase inhibitor domain-containing protein [Rosa chinensis]|uniref:Putative pectinesterase inhibitor domain-containing protein n=1 Tax=Rosa chinensis TaxID=74649 RepID=A0A2P6P9L4_ROSCH|nr:putative pectinesterase inhibitor domain-containing protein [Rosa chinensis]